MILSVLSNGLKIFSDNFWRGLGAAAGIIPLHHIPLAFTDVPALLKKVDDAGGFGFVSTRRAIDISLFQKMTDGATNNPFGHSQLLIGDDIAHEVRERYPELMELKPSPRWPNRNSYEPPIMVEGISKNVKPYEVVESQLHVAVTSLLDTLNQGEQVVVFINKAWTREQKIQMAREAYSWVGEPYDIFEIGNWAIPLIPHSKSLKVCSSLVCKCIAAGDSKILTWCKLHNIDPEKISPGGMFAYGSDIGCEPYCFRCNYDDVLKA